MRSTWILGPALALIAAAASARAQPVDAPGPLHDGAVALEAGRFDAAVALFERAAAEPGPARAWAWFDLCLAHHLAGAYGDAIDACYRALQDPLTEDRVVPVLGEIAAAILANHLDVSGLTLPDPRADWFRPGPQIDTELAIALTPPVTEVGLTRAQPRIPLPVPATLVPIAPDRAARLRGEPPPLPYRVPPRRHDYSVGYDLDLKSGLLFYAPDTTPFVIGLRGARRSRLFGAGGHAHSYVEYLQAVDGHGGVAAGGVGVAAEDSFGLESGFSVPWGRDEGRQNATFPGYTLSLHADLTLSYRRELVLGWSNRISIAASITGSVNLPKLAIRIGDAFGDLCTHDPCPNTPDGNRRWPLAYWMVNLAIGFGHRAGYPRYDHAEVWAPAGGPPP